MADLKIVDAPVLLQESITDDVKMPTGGLGNFSIHLGDIVWYVVNKEQLVSKSYVDLSSKGVQDKLDTHVSAKDNPHNVTKAQVGLGNVDNTADIDKPVSDAVSSAIITATTDMATKAYVNQQGNLKADVAYVNSKGGDLTTLTTTDKTSLVKAINEVVNVKADKATTLVGYGITDAYTKSEIDTNYGGVKTLYDKNVVAGAGANGWTADLVLDSTQNKTQSQINSNQEKLNTVLNKIGTTETLAESVDATPFLQSLINAMPNGMTLDLLGKTFRVKKNTGFISDYPKGDQPCLVVKDKKNVRITNGKLIVKEHGQGCIDVINSKADFDGLTIQGAGNFPLLDGTTGRGEKGLQTAGYFDLDFYNFGDPRNNSVDTSGYSGGGYGGAFPQWGGGTASTWGVWNGGYIKNIGDGIFVMGDSDVHIENCDIYGFNGASATITEGRLTAERNKFHDNYNWGVFGKAIKEGMNKFIETLQITNNDIYNIGHPNSQKTDIVVDPGYGVGTSNKIDAYSGGVRRYTVLNNNFYNCKRKAVDGHHSYYFHVSGNRIESCGFGIISTINAAGTPPKATIITDNFIKDIQHALQGAVSAVAVVSDASSNGNRLYKGFVNIANNVIEDVGILKSIYDANKAQVNLVNYGILVYGVESPIITGNSVVNSKLFMTDGGISDGYNEVIRCPRSVITSNIVRGGMKFGILTYKDTSNQSNATLQNAGVISANMVDITPRHDTATAIGVFAGVLSKVTGNIVLKNNGVTPYSDVNPAGSVISFNHNTVSGSVSVVNQPETLNFTSSNFVVSTTIDTRTIKLPTNCKIGSILIEEMDKVRTASVAGLRWDTGQSTGNEIKIRYYSVTNGVATTVPLADITGGGLRITVNLI